MATTTPFLAALIQAIRGFIRDRLKDSAAALTYYGLLALFPALIALVSLLGLVGDPHATTRTVTEIITKIGPHSAAETFEGPIESITAQRRTAGVLGIAGVIAALWSASSYVSAFARASHIIYQTPEASPFWRRRPLQMLVTLIMLILVAMLAIAVVLTGPIVRAIATPLGVGSTAVEIWDIAKWPVMLVVVMFIVSILFHATANARLSGFRWITPGSVLAVALWLVASGLFAFYVANFGSFDAIYGALGGFVIFLVWLWISNSALLLGMSVNAERERTPAQQHPPTG